MCEIEIRTLKECLDAVIPPLELTSQLSSTKTTKPISPRFDDFLLRVWPGFQTELDKFKNSAKQIRPHVFPISISNEPPLVSDEGTVSDAFREIFKNLITFGAACVGKDVVFGGGNATVGLKPDIVLYEKSRINDKLHRTAKLVVEMKTLWAMSLSEQNSFVDIFYDELDRYKRSYEPKKKSPRLSTKTVPALARAAVNESKETKIIRNVVQLYGYMSVNYLKYGALCTYDGAVFFRREERENGVPVLEASNIISRDKITLAFVYIINSLLDNYVYSSPYTTPNFSTRIVSASTSPFEVVSINICDLYAAEPYLIKGGETTAFIGRSIKSKDSTAVFKLIDTKKDKNLLERFYNELKVYEELSKLHVAKVHTPKLTQAFVASGFIYGLELEDCGVSIDKKEVKGYLGQIKDAVAGLHEAGIAHNDIACRNTLLKDGIITLIDFGFSRFDSDCDDDEWDALKKKDFSDVERLEMSDD